MSKLMTKAIINKESGTSFDLTDISKIKQRAGSHDVVPKKKLDVSAFSTNKILKKSLSSEFMKKNSGNGGNSSNGNLQEHINLITEFAIRHG